MSVLAAATYNTARGPTIATRTWQWNQVFAKENRRDFVRAVWRRLWVA